MSGTLWNPKSDPLPPTQPKEVSYLEYATYVSYTLDDGKILNDAYVTGTTMSSYSRLCQQTQAAGSNIGEPVMTFSFDNYTSPTDPKAALYAQYGVDGGECSYSGTEGGASFPGYNQYSTDLQEFYADGLTIYYDYTNYSDYGPSYVYTVLLPWPYYPPRSLTYTLVYQANTGYLRLYALNGTEYCCKSTKTCVTSGLSCGDGTNATLTWTNSSTFYSQYQVYNESSFPEGFFGPYCPFPETSPSPAPTSANSTTKALDLSGGDIASIVLAIVLLLGACGVGMLVQNLFSKKAPMSKSEEREPKDQL